MKEPTRKDIETPAKSTLVPASRPYRSPHTREPSAGQEQVASGKI